MGIQRLHHEDRPDLFVPPDFDRLRQFFEDRLADGSHVLLAEVGEKAAGYIFAQHSAREASPFLHASSLLYVHHIAVEPDLQASGVGTALMSAVDDLASSLGAKAIRLDSWHFNESAHAFFRARGFKPINIVFERVL